MTKNIQEQLTVYPPNVADAIKKMTWQKWQKWHKK
jgi:hypothetical protein